MRIEKGYHGWGADIGTEYTLFDAGLSRFANMSKVDFTGRAALEKQAKNPADWTFVGLEIEPSGPEPLPSDPILKDQAVIGYITSCNAGYRMNKRVALGYVKTGTLAMDEDCHVQCFGKTRRARRHSPHQYDPDNARLKG